jgi:hypothetical protein
MGWCSGDGILAEVWGEVRAHLPEEIRVDVFKRLIRMFEMYDLDCYSAIEETPEGKEALKQLHPKWYEDDD